MEKEFNYQVIEDYVNGKLEGAAKKAFESEMAADEGLAREVAFYQDLSEVSEVIGDENLESLISDIGAELDSENFFEEKGAIVKTLQPKTKSGKEATQKQPRIGIRRLMSLAASFLILVTLGAWWWANANFSDEALALNYYNQDTIQSISRTPEGSKDVFAEGLEALNSKNYTETIRFFSNIPSTDEAYAEARLYLAIAQFKIQDYQNAIANAKIVTQRSSRFQEKARWLQINAMLGAGQTGAEFENLLNDMATNSPDNYYRNEASRLKKDLDRFWRKFVF